jgi:hypothetical protein
MVILPLLPTESITVTMETDPDASLFAPYSTAMRVDSRKRSVMKGDRNVDVAS